MHFDISRRMSMSCIVLGRYRAGASAGQSRIRRFIRNGHLFKAFAGGGGQSYLNFIFYMTIAELAVFFSLAGAALISYCPPPRTFSCLFGSDNFSSIQAETPKSSRTACHGRLCTFCRRKCFLMEGMTGECKMRMNSGGRNDMDR